MKKKEIKMISFSLVLFIIIFLLSPFMYNVKAELKETEKTTEEQTEMQGKIMHYNAKTGETTEVDMNAIIKNLKEKFGTNQIPNYTRQYTPDKFIKNYNLYDINSKNGRIYMGFSIYNRPIQKNL